MDKEKVYLHKTMIHAIRLLPLRPLYQRGGLTIQGLATGEFMKPGWVDRPRGTGDRLMMYFHQACEVTDGEGRRLRPPGSLVFWPSGSPHFYGSGQGPWCHSWLHGDGKVMDQLFKQTGVLENRVITGFDGSRFASFLEAVHRELSHGDRADGLILQNLLENMLREVRRHGSPMAGIPKGLAEVHRHLENNYRQVGTVAQWAAMAGYSVPHFSALWRKNYGSSPLHFAINLRLGQAAYLLRDQNLTVAAIAEACGFEDLYYFSRLFKKHQGKSPRAYRKEIFYDIG